MAALRPFFNLATGEWVTARAAVVPDRGDLRRGWECGRNKAWRITGGAGLITVLTLITAVILAISGRCPQQIFDLVMGLNRWCYRVLAYVALMRDEYPPSRLDTGGTDPGHLSPLPAAARPLPISGKTTCGARE
jgi:hypothetical protein